ncbi:MAG: energy-coupling factor transporter transmembrane protein EcfT [Firmicutes bacterium]|nr:energy-coupling factor transporter transmembrane protein EcfT [Bacillota bacterium]
MKIKLFSYNQLDTFIHKLSGLTKLVCFLFLTTAVMVNYDVRITFMIFILSIVLMKIAQVSLKQIKPMVILVLIFVVTNFFLGYLFAPEYGIELFGTKHLLFSITGPYTVTLEEMYYLFCKSFKYIAVIPLGIIFFLTTNPSEFASSLNKIGVSYKICTVLNLTLRYFPDIQRDYNAISKAQQARGLDMSKKEKVFKRLKNTTAILIPLVMTTIDRIGTITNAMELRGYGKHKKRSWYAFRSLSSKDYVCMLVCLLIFVVSFMMRIYVNNGLYWNPFL